MIKVEKHDSLVDILRKIAEKDDEKIILDFPFGHPILHNYSCLKILKVKAEQKEVIISTNDKTAQKIGKKLGIKYSLTNNPDLVGHNYGFWEYFLYTIKSYIRQSRQHLLKKSQETPFVRYQQKYASGKIGFFVAFLLLSMLVLFSVFYFAVNRTYVYITPEIEVKTKGHNFVFKELGSEENTLDDRVIKLRKVEKTVSLSETFGTSGIKSDNISSASGLVTVYNLLPKEVQLVKNTRLQTKQGLVFLLETDITIPPADVSGVQVQPGEAESSAIARVLDINNNIIGKSGNIKSGTAFSLPGLTENKNKIYAVSKEKFTGGADDYIRVLSEKDIENAKGILETKLQKEGLKQIKQDIETGNEVNNVTYEILLADGSIQYKDFNVTGLDNIKTDQELDSFKLYGTIKTVAYTYNKDTLVGKMKSIVAQTILEDVEDIINIDTKSMQVIHEISRKNEETFSTKQTVFVDVFYMHNFHEKNENYVNRIKASIVGKSKEDAQKILINNQAISNAEIKIRPFFVKNVSKFIGNVEFIIKKK